MRIARFELDRPATDSRCIMRRTVNARCCWISGAKRGADERKFSLVSVEELREESRR